MVAEPKPTDMPIFLVGATGTGKSAAAMELARNFGGAKGAVILCLDAMQIYREADIGTSKPTAEERAEIPHGGLDLADFAAAGWSGYDVAQYVRHAATFLSEQRQAGRRVIVVGGTGLYFRALTRGLCEAPQGSEELRTELAALSVGKLQARLKAIDPAMLERLDASNPRRLARAIEVRETTGRSLRAWQEETPEPLVRDFTAIWIQREKTELEVRIETRVEAMFAAGWLEEVRGLVERYGFEAMRSFPGIGYREIAEGLREPNQISKSTELPNSEADEGGKPTKLILRQSFGGASLAQDDGPSGGDAGKTAGTHCTVGKETARTRGRALSHGMGRLPWNTAKRNICVATRQYAKRQLTWFAREPNLQQVMLTGNQPLSSVLARV